MESSTTIIGMTRGNLIFVQDYQRAYSWDTGKKDSDLKKQVNTFLNDLQDYLRSDVVTPYYFGHFLYEKIGDNKYAIIDGQQRLTTIVIFVSALFKSIAHERELTEREEVILEDMIKRKSSYKFSTVQYDNQLFRDYVIDHLKKDHYGIETTSGHRLVAAYDYFQDKLQIMNLTTREALLSAVVNASCTTHIVNGEAEAIQMFIFQNDRGKKPSNLEIIKAQFMYNIHIYGGEDTEALIQEVKNRFEHVYRSISDIEEFVDEDAVLTHTLKIYFNSLWESNTIERINAEITKPDRLDFIKNFTIELDRSFNNISRLNKDRKESVFIEGALLCGRFDIILPFFIKAYTNGIELKEIERMAKVLGDLVLRDVVIKTRADLRSRLDGVFKSFSTSIEEIIERINYMKYTTDWWWAYWNNDTLKNAVESNWYSNYHSIAKIILWKYENFLIEKEGKAGYAPISYSSIKNPHLEHIAPQTENEEVAAGYDTYDEDFKEKYLLSLGNFLLLSAPHNESIGNRPFASKRESYNQLKQQREIQIMTENDCVWDRVKIAERREKIVNFILEYL
jgi:hypothetical protein